jgi:predicted ATPase/class 3 adenylate cyclase
MDEREQLEHAITALEAQRLLLGNMVVDTALAPLRERLSTLIGHETTTGHQRKQVTVLFADVSGFTAMSETMDAEDVSLTMNALWAPLDRAIVKHGGTIDKHIGDAVMALFGAPTTSEDDPENAIRAALDMQAAIAGFSRTIRDSLQADRPLPAISMRIGINTGPVLLGSVGSTGEYTAMGDTVNLASRLEHAAPVGGILISHATYRHVRGVFDVLPLDPISVKGKAEPIQVYVVRKAKPRAFRVTTRGVEGVETGTIGREAELRQVQERLLRASAERVTQSVTIVADAGVGKSRLLYEFNNWLELQPERTLLFKGRCTQEMARMPYSLIRAVFATRFDIQESDSAALAREKLTDGIMEHLGPEASEQAHFIGHLIGLDFSASPFIQSVLGDTRQLRDRAFHYCCQYFAAVAQASRTVLLLEDIHWADDGSLDMIEHLLYQQPSLPLLILGLARATLYERRPVWGAVLRNHERIDLKPLTGEQTRQLVREILKHVDQIPRRLEDLIVSRVEGNPFYVEELIKMLIEDGVIVVGEPRWRVTLERLDSVRVPPTLTGVLQSRLDGLPPLEREIMHRAAVVGRVFWSEVIDRITAAQPAEQSERIANRLESLSSKELIFKRETSAFASTDEYIFKHAILHDVTYERVLKSLRRTYHAQVAEALIDLSGERVLEYAGRIGEHFELAGNNDQAATWYAQAGQQAQETYAPATAISYYQKALALWDSQASPQTLDALGGLGDMLISQAQYEEAIAIFTAMRDGAQRLGDQRKLARAWCGIASAQSPLGDHHGTLASAIAAEHAARAADAAEEIALALWMQGRSSFRLGDVDSALSLGEQMLAYTTEHDAPRLQTRSLNLLGAIHHIIGDYEAAEAYFARGLGLCLRLNDQRQIMDLSNNLGVIAEARGDYQLALKRYEEALDVARNIGNRDGELVFLSNLGAARIGLGDYPGAIRDLHEVIDLAGETAVSGLADTFQYLAQAYLGVGQRDDALAAARRALGLSYHENNPAFIAATWRVLGTIAAQGEPLHGLEIPNETPRSYDAPACFATSLRVCDETGMAGERARTLRDWATHEIQRGDAARGLGMWEASRALFGELGAEQEVARMASPPSSGDERRA